MTNVVNLAQFRDRLFTKEEFGFFENLFQRGKALGVYKTLEESCKDNQHKLTITSISLTDSVWDDRPREKSHFLKKRHADGSFSYEYFDGKMEIDVAGDNHYSEPKLASNAFHIMIPRIIAAQQDFIQYLQRRLAK